METIKELAMQIAIPVEGFTLDSRLFAVELETPKLTKMRNKLLRVMSNKKAMKSKQGLSKADLVKALGCSEDDRNFNDIASKMCVASKEGHMKLKPAFE